jgi:uncharacterized protein (TIGR03435 family)
MKSEEHDIERLLKRSLPSEQEVEAAGKLVLEELRSMQVGRSIVADNPDSERRPRFLLAFAAAVIVSIVTAIVVKNTRGGSELVRASDPAGKLLELRDGSQVEMRSQSVLRIDEAVDGLGIHLNEGSVIVTAAKQNTGHLYVETKDAVVSVVGTVFVVSVEEAGSRVGVLEGVVNVRQGMLTKELLPAQQITTNPQMGSVPIEEQVSWSRNAVTLLALLHQPTSPAPQQPPVAGPPPLPTPKPPEKIQAFEVVSVRPSDVSIDRVGRGGALPSGYGCGGSFLQVDPRRFAITTTVLNLVAMAYGRECIFIAKQDLLGGGPSWVKSEQFTIQAVIPEGSPSYTVSQLRQGKAPELQKMIQTLLADRFKLTLRHEVKEQPVYALTVAKNGSKLTPFNDANCDAPRQGQMPPCGQGIFWVDPKSHFNVIANGMTLDAFADVLTGLFNRPVVNRTGITGSYFLQLDSAMEYTMFCQEPPCTNQFLGTPSDNPPLIFDAIQQQLGLKLESMKAPVEQLVIDHVERPQEN